MRDWSGSVKTIRRLRELSDPEALRLFVWSLLTVLLAACLLRARRLPALLHHLAQPPHARTGPAAWLRPDAHALEQVWRYSHVIITTLLRSRRPCLLRSLVLCRYCWKHGIPVSIHCGVKPGMDGLGGHSWITLDGAPLFESSETLKPYTVVYSYPETGRDEVCPRQTGAMVEAR